MVWTFLDMWPMCGGDIIQKLYFIRMVTLKKITKQFLFDLNYYLWKKNENWNTEFIKVFV